MQQISRRLASLILGQDIRPQLHERDGRRVCCHCRGHVKGRLSEVVARVERRASLDLVGEIKSPRREIRYYSRPTPPRKEPC